MRKSQKATTALNNAKHNFNQSANSPSPEAEFQDADAQDAYQDLSRDIAKTRIEDPALMQSEKRFRTVFNAAPLGIAIANPDGFFLDVNQAFTKMLGYRKNDIKKMTFVDITYPEDRREDEATPWLEAFVNTRKWIEKA